MQLDRGYSDLFINSQDKNYEDTQLLGLNIQNLIKFKVALPLTLALRFNDDIKLNNTIKKQGDRKRSYINFFGRENVGI